LLPASTTVALENFDGTDSNHPLSASTFGTSTSGKLESEAGGFVVSGDGTGAWPYIMPPGAILAYGGASAPSGWLLCDGSAVSRTTYADLFAAIGTAYGTGDGSTTFNLPDLRQRFPLGKAASGTGSTLGGTGGSIDHSHTAQQTGSSEINPQGGGSLNAARQAHTHDTTTANPPYQVVNFLIKT
jgi:microcystin-dependent protein